MPSSRWWRDAVAMATLVAALGIVTIAAGERIGINGGQGWDGLAYTEWARDFWKHVVVDHLTRYHAQRVLPSAVVHYALRAVGAAPSVGHVIRAFAILNVVLLAGSAVLWAHLGHVLRWRRAATWVGFVALFACFANAKHALYYPTLTDPAAFALGMLLAWGYLADRPVAIWIAALLGSVTWPALPPLAIAMLVLPRPARALEPPTQRQRLPAAVLAITGALVFVAVALHYLHHPVPGVGDDKFAKWVRGDLLPLTLPLLVAMLAAGGYALAAATRWRGYLGQLRRGRLVIALGMTGVVYVLRAIWLANVGTAGDGPTTAQFLCEHTLAAIRGPLWGPVHHVVYFGPIVCVAALAWRRIAEVLAGWGPAAVLGIAMALAFMAGSNSRQWNHLFPLLVVATVAATAELWTPRRVLGFTALALAWSKLWLHLGYDVPLDWHEFPNQRYFMNTGPYAADGPYVVHLCAVALTTVVVAILLRRGDTPCATLDA